MRVFYVDWSQKDCLAAASALRAAGHTVAYHWDRESGADTWRKLKESPPDVLVVSLARLPSHGRRVAAVTTETKKLRHIPVLFVDGAPEKVAVTRQEFPAAKFTTTARLAAALSALR